MITTESIKINLEFPINTESIETSLKDTGIIPLRWAITEIDGNCFTINVSYEK